MGDDGRERLMSAWSATPSAEELARVRAAATAARRLRLLQLLALGAWCAAALTAAFAPERWGLGSLAERASLWAIVAWVALAYLEARRAATAGTPADAALGHVARGLRDERERELRWWIGGWTWGAWIAAAALLVALLSGPARMQPRGGHVAVLMLIAVVVLVTAAVRHLRELRLSADLARLDALVAGMSGSPPEPPRVPRRSARAALRLLELGVAAAAAVIAALGPDRLAVNAREFMTLVEANAHWSQRLGLAHGGNAVPVAGDIVDRYCSLRARMAPSLAAFADAERHAAAALAVDLEERAGVGERHDVRRQEHAIAWEKARMTLLTAADRALRGQGLRPADLREVGARVETHDASAAFRLPPPQARALVAARLRVQALEAVLAQPGRSAIHALATAELRAAREDLARRSAEAGPAAALAAAPCGTEPLPGLDWLTVLDAEPSPWNEALR